MPLLHCFRSLVDLCNKPLKCLVYRRMYRGLTSLICLLTCMAITMTTNGQNLIRVGVAYQLNTHMETENPDIPAQLSSTEDDLFHYASLTANFDIPFIDWATISVGGGFNYSLNRQYLDFPFLQAAIRMYSWDVHEGFYGGGYGATGLNFDLAYYAFGLTTGVVWNKVDLEAKLGYGHTTSSVGSTFRPRFSGVQAQIGMNLAINQGHRKYGRR